MAVQELKFNESILIDFSFFVFLLPFLLCSIGELEESSAQAKQATEIVSKLLSAKEEETSRVLKALEELRIENAETRSALLQAQTAVDETATQLQLLLMDLETRRAEEEVMRDQMTSKDAQILDMRLQISSLQGRNEALESRAKELPDHTELEMLREQLDGALAQITTAQSEAETAKQQTHLAERAAADLRQVCSELTEAVKSAREELGSAKMESTEKSEEINSLKERIEGLLVENRSHVETVAAREQAAQDLQEQLEEETRIHTEQVACALLYFVLLLSWDVSAQFWRPLYFLCALPLLYFIFLHSIPPSLPFRLTYTHHFSFVSIFKYIFKKTTVILCRCRRPCKTCVALKALWTSR